ncbi:tyrosine-type recombinase/integrase [Terricaulis sp.]|uniref:tyrosine-type recombinase/integrase n=1 Tax=Terricaulis sp. TaxID=2768686 RepID=UPI003784AB3A
MPQVELSDKFCRAAKASGGAKTDYFDTTVKGLCLRVSAAGMKTWHAVYSKPDGKRAWLKLGRYPDVPLGGNTGARQRARDARAKVSEGGDPVAEKKAQASAQTVRDLVENYLSRRITGRRSYAEVARRLRKNVSGCDLDGNTIEGRSVGCIGNLKLADLHRRDITKAIDAVKDRGAGTEANRVFEDVRAMVRWARGRGDLDDNIVEGMSKPTATKDRERVLLADEIAAMWAALPHTDMREATRRVLRLCLVTAQRVGEVAGMTRAELDLQRALWTIPAARAKNGREHVVPLSDMALRILREQIADVDALSARKRRDVPGFVFPAPGARAPVTGASVAKAVKREEKPVTVSVTEPVTLSVATMGVAPWTPHDLRRTAATCMEELGVSPFVVGHVLNHVSATKATVTSRVYARYDYAKEKREALELWEARLMSLVVDGGAKVVPLRAVSS